MSEVIRSEHRYTDRKKNIIEALKAGGICNRPKKLLPADQDYIFRNYHDGKLTASDAMRLLGIGRTSFCRFVANRETERGK